MRIPALFIVIISVFIQPTFGQNFELFDSARSDYFKTGIQQDIYYFSYLTNYSNSPIKATRIDSSLTIATGIIHYPFRTWRDTTALGMSFGCSFKNGPGWMGTEIHELNNGSVLLFNYNNDTVRFEPQASLGTSWTFLQLSGGKTVQATVDSFFTVTVAGISDITKQIRLTVVDSVGQNDSLHALHNRILWLSESHGFFKTISFRDLPGYVELNRMEPIPAITKQDLYRFNIGDEFEYTSSCVYFGTNNQPPSYQYWRILDYWYSPNADSLFYSRLHLTMTLTYNPVPTPHLDSIVASTTDTVSYTDLNQLFHAAVPEQNTLQQLSPAQGFGVYLIKQDSLQFNNRPIFSETDQFYWSDDSCIYFNNFEPVFYTYEVSPGLGSTGTIFDNQSIAGGVCRNTLTWYRKSNGETYGNFVNLFTDVATPAASEQVSVYPNPSNGLITISGISNRYEKLQVVTQYGALLQEVLINTEQLQLQEAPGVYVLLFIGKDRTAAHRIVILD